MLIRLRICTTVCLHGEQTAYKLENIIRDMIYMTLIEGVEAANTPLKYIR